MKDTTFCDAIFMGYCKSKTGHGYDIIFTIDGIDYQLPSTQQNRTKSDEAWDKRTISLKKIGSIQPSVDGHYFEIYQDQSLRRMPELDIINNEQNISLIGWKNDKYPSGFVAPYGVIPDFGREYFAETNEVLCLLIPKEMEQISTQYGISPEELFNNFIKALTDNNQPFSNRRLEQPYQLAKAYLQASYGMCKESVYDASLH